MAGLSKLNSACAEKHCESQKNVNVIIRNGQNQEKKVYILKQLFFAYFFTVENVARCFYLFLFSGLLYRKRVLFLIHRCLVSTNCTYSPIWVIGLPMVRKKREIHITEIRLVGTNKSMRPY